MRGWEDGEVGPLPELAEPAGGRPYTRHILGREGDLEWMLARWAVGARCAFHDHGGAEGRVFILRGRFLESDIHGAVRELRAPARVEVEPERVHRMEAPEGGLTLHLYRGGDRPMRIYDLENGRVLEAEGGAWLPADRVLSSTPWGRP